MKPADWMRVLIIVALAAVVGACASIGRPEGGPRDEVPPEFVRSNPAPGSLNVDRTKIDIYFNENIKLDDASNKVVVSPAQKENPRLDANGRRLTVELRDSLLANTTYTIDFSDAVRDLNEGNILDGFAMDFSTGDVLDTLRISGMVFEARTLEPAQGMVVGVHSNLSDTALTSLKLERVAKTNQYGQFTIRNLKPGTYNLFAIDDRNHDWRWDRSENIAFSSVTISPSVESVEVADTLRASTGEDSVVVRQAWHYIPDDILLTWFNENYRSQYLRDNARTDARRVTLKFGAPLDSMPELQILNGPRKGSSLADLSVIEMRQERDSLVYWMCDTALVAQDSLLVEARYRKTDSLENLVWQTDTLKLFLRNSAKAKKEKKKKKDEEADSLPQLTFLDIKVLTDRSQHLHLPVRIEAASPVASIDSAGWKLEIAQDSVWHRVAGVGLRPDSVNVRQFLIEHKWDAGRQYRLIVDSAAIVNFYGEFNKPFVHDFTVRNIEDYGNLFFNITDAPDSTAVMVELLSSADEVVKAVKVEKGVATFTFVDPATYYARAYIDVNGNGRWDTGSVADSVQPEDVFYFTKKLNVRKNWDIDQDWSLFSTPVDLQKPDAVKKNKPKTRDRNRSDAGEADEQDEDTFLEQGQWGNGSQYNNAGRRSSGTGSTSGLRTSRGNELAR